MNGARLYSWQYTYGQFRHHLTPGINLMSFVEIFLKEADHTYTLTGHRNILLLTILNWLENEFTCIENHGKS